MKPYLLPIDIFNILSKYINLICSFCSLRIDQDYKMFWAILKIKKCKLINFTHVKKRI